MKKNRRVAPRYKRDGSGDKRVFTGYAVRMETGCSAEDFTQSEELFLDFL
jgi:hypothetical protein